MPLPPVVPKANQNDEAMMRRMDGEKLPAPKNGSEALKSIVLKACSVDPQQRYSDPTAMRKALERIAFAEEQCGGIQDVTDSGSLSVPNSERLSASGADDTGDLTIGVFASLPDKPIDCGEEQSSTVVVDHTESIPTKLSSAEKEFEAADEEEGEKEPQSAESESQSYEDEKKESDIDQKTIVLVVLALCILLVLLTVLISY